jgi:hypothetical protein
MISRFKPVAVTALLLFGAIAPAQAIDFTQPLKDLSGNDFTDQNGKAVPLTLGEVVEASLRNTPTANEQEKDKNYYLMLSVHFKATDFTPTPEQIIQIRKALAATQPTLVYGQAMSKLDSTFVAK